ncbi:2-hydroxyacyl-CoA lyase 1 [Wickerhamomyces ciferrii]|uniref:2-hydroxyacyl-CoA lyase n=1 Tax=Wickerhamomyces ciferrii (strain ATCC 14091 / BCRC 22168 / CBS 111 / JCM 3599 / NBRC 0793 / NRRL Y-1031 F-60-10) TaxID=1206466 RepID=K0KK19_WICCF|nr:2-hydroxyacyl-CoA lyase 1 [Wickerhamomyces ciferrii]CCH42522.1 2-hydroxyacyl-CoA lyase 1 [Wickerhamomyces ciferrii]
MSSGAKLIAKVLKKLGVTTVFGIVGIPIVEVGDALIAEGVKFIAFRNEQAASYAASAHGYLTGKPGVLLVVGGPGVVHAAAGIFNSNANRWPLLVLAGSSSINDVSKGGFQELDQISFLSPYTKFSGRPLSIDQIPSYLFKAYKTSFFGVPGSTYIDLPADLVEGELSEEEEQHLLKSVSQLSIKDIPTFVPPKNQILQIAKTLHNAKSPLIIVGKGSAYSGASSAITNFVETHKIPFLPTPMGKGVVPDDSYLNVSSARSKALKSADVIILLGARLNWILHFGEAPRFKEDAIFIQVDQSPEEVGNNSSLSISYGLVGDISLVIQELNKHIKSSYTAPPITDDIKQTIEKNNKSLEAKENKHNNQLTYQNVYKVIRGLINPIEKNTVLVSEGANTMDVARISFPQNYPRLRLDAGTNATMGVGLGYAIAAKAVHPNKHVVAIEGDSAFGFSGLEIETAVRAHLPIIIVVMNNSGLYKGIDTSKHSYDDYKSLPSTALSKETRYDLLAQSLGARGILVKTSQEVHDAFSQALENSTKGETTILNVIISPGEQKKVGFGWQNKKKQVKL